jgi:neurotransmitter:Na+ symporter, NSS family
VRCIRGTTAFLFPAGALIFMAGGAKSQDKWSSKTGFVVASIGAAVGLGNVWRFPYIASENGGIWFLLPYFICLALVGIPLFLLEAGQGFLLGKDYFRTVSQSPNIPFVKKRLRAAVAFFPIIVSIAILGYYLALCGWTLWFAVEFILGNMPTFGMMQSSYTPIMTFLVVFASSYYVALRGISKGIEPVTGYLVPMLFAFLFLLFIYSLSLPGAISHIAGLFDSGSEKLLDPRTWYYALSQVLFSLSVGYGIMYTYGLHLKRGKQVFLSAWEVAGADTAASLLAFFTIVALAASVGGASSGLALSFEALPAFFASQGLFGTIVGIAFFALLFSAAFTSVISMVEHTHASTERLGRAGKPAAVAAVFALGLLSALSYSPLGLQAFGKPILDQLDFVFGTFLAPFSALAVVMGCAYFLPHKGLARAIGVPDKYGWIFVLAIRKIIPAALLLLIIFSQMSGLY